MQNHPKNTAFLLLGSNLGDRLLYLNRSIDAILSNGIQLLKASSIYETDPWGVSDQQPFLNQALKIETILNPQQLLQTILSVEKELGRERAEKWGSRTIDIDILYFNDDTVDLDNLKIPHPYLDQRRFALTPLCELDGKYIHPVLKKTNNELLAICPDTLKVRKI